LTTESPPRSDAQVHTSRTRRLDGESPCVFLDATFEKVRENWRVISIAVLIAVGVRSTGEREVVGIDVGSAEDREFWRETIERDWRCYRGEGR
jgi:putative transposase